MTLDPKFTPVCLLNRIGCVVSTSHNELIFFRDIDDQRILESNWIRGKPRRMCWSHMLYSLTIISVQKIKDIDWFFPVILLIEESFYLVVREAYLSKFNQM